MAEIDFDDSSTLQLAELPARWTPEDEELLARIIFAESANHYSKAKEAMQGVGWTVINRLGDREFGSTLSDVILKQHDGKYHFQGVTNELWTKSENVTKLAPADLNAFAHAKAVAKGILNGEIPDPTGGAQFFYTTKDGTPPRYFTRALEAGRVVPISPSDKNFGEFRFLMKPPRR